LSGVRTLRFTSFSILKTQQQIKDCAGADLCIVPAATHREGGQRAQKKAAGSNFRRPSRFLYVPESI
jgi:hypothetical protein